MDFTGITLGTMLGMTVSTQCGQTRDLLYGHTFVFSTFRVRGMLEDRTPSPAIRTLRWVCAGRLPNKKTQDMERLPLATLQIRCTRVCPTPIATSGPQLCHRVMERQDGSGHLTSSQSILPQQTGWLLQGRHLVLIRIGRGMRPLHQLPASSRPFHKWRRADVWPSACLWRGLA